MLVEAQLVLYNSSYELGELLSCLISDALLSSWHLLLILLPSKSSTIANPSEK